MPEPIALKRRFFICALLTLFLRFALASAKAQPRVAEKEASPILKADSAFVWVPALVKTDRGETPSRIDVSRWHLFDNGIPESLTEIDTRGLPISLVVLMQTGGSASQFLSTYWNLPGLIDSLAGSSVHEITLVTFDSHVDEIWHFPARTDGVDYALTHQHSGDKGAAVKDAVAFGVRQLQGESGIFRRIVLLLCQSNDVGSSISSRELLEQLGTSSTVIYSLTFTDKETYAGRVQEKKDTSSIDETLARTERELNERTAEEVADLTGGASFQFDDLPSFNSAMLETVSDFRSRLTLGFQPNNHDAGYHRIEVRGDSRKLRLTARRAYWRPRPE